MAQEPIFEEEVRITDAEGNYFCRGCGSVQEPEDHFKLYKNADDQIVLAYCEDCDPPAAELQIITDQGLTCEEKDIIVISSVATSHIDDPFEQPRPVYGAPHQTTRDKIYA